MTGLGKKAALRLRLRHWWRHHWWPARIRRLDRERADWRRWCISNEKDASGYHDQLEMAWIIIANSSDWNADWNEGVNDEWVAAATTWRDKYHEGMVRV